MTEGSSRALVRTKKEMKKLPCHRHISPHTKPTAVICTKDEISKFNRRKGARRECTHKPKPRKNQIKRLIQQFDMDPRFTPERVRRAVDEVELDGAVDGGEEGAVEPSAALRDEFGDLCGVVGGVWGRGWNVKSVRSFVR